MNQRAFPLIILTYALVIAGLVLLNGNLLALAVPFILFLGISYWRSPRNIDLEIQRRVERERISPGQPLRVTITVNNLGDSLEEVIMEDILPAGLDVLHGSPRHFLELPGGKSFTWEYKVSGSRGYYQFSEVKAEVYDRFGLSVKKKSYPVKGQVFILPPVARIQRIDIRPRRTNVYSGNIPARKGGVGVEFFDVRAYQPGDPPHWINWNASARHPDELFSNAYEQERVADVSIILDGRLRTNVLRDEHSLFEYSVQAAASMADTFLTQGNQVGLLLYAHYLRWTFPGYGKIQRERILQSLARAEPGESMVFANLAHIPTRFFPPHSQIVLISPLSSEDMEVLIELRARGYQIMVVSPNPILFERNYLNQDEFTDLAARILILERKLMLRNLRGAGVQVLDWNVSNAFDKINLAVLRRPKPWFKAIRR